MLNVVYCNLHLHVCEFAINLPCGIPNCPFVKKNGQGEAASILFTNGQF